MSSNPLSEHTLGDGIDVQENATPFNLVCALNFTLEQNFSLKEKDNLNLIAGRLGATPYFMGNDLSCLFMNHAFCGPMYGFYQSTLSSVAPAPTWGGRAKFNATPNAYVEFGGFAIDSNTIQASTSIFTWNTRGVTAINYLAEAGHATTLAEQKMPHYYRVGVSYVDGPRPDVLLNTNGLPRFQYGGTPLDHRDETAVYATGAQVIRRQAPTPRPNLTLFGSMYYNFANSEAMKYAIKAGIAQTGLFQRRTDDGVLSGPLTGVFTADQFNDRPRPGAGIALGLMAMWLVFDSIGAKSAVRIMKDTFAHNLDILAEQALPWRDGKTCRRSTASRAAVSNKSELCSAIRLQRRVIRIA